MVTGKFKVVEVSSRKGTVTLAPDNMSGLNDFYALGSEEGEITIRLSLPELREPFVEDGRFTVEIKQDSGEPVSSPIERIAKLVGNDRRFTYNELGIVNDVRKELGMPTIHALSEASP